MNKPNPETKPSVKELDPQSDLCMEFSCMFGHKRASRTRETLLSEKVARSGIENGQLLADRLDAIMQWVWDDVSPEAGEIEGEAQFYKEVRGLSDEGAMALGEAAARVRKLFSSLTMSVTVPEEKVQERARRWGEQLGVEPAAVEPLAMVGEKILTDHYRLVSFANYAFARRCLPLISSFGWLGVEWVEDRRLIRMTARVAMPLEPARYGSKNDQMQYIMTYSVAERRVVTYETDRVLY